MPPVSEETERSRAENYDVLALLLVRAPSAEVLDLLAGIDTDHTTALGRAWAALAQAAAQAKPEALAREHFVLFTGVGRGELLPFASFYITGFLHERPLAELRSDLARLGIARLEGDHDPEDRIALILSVMAAFARGDLAGQDLGQAEFYARHLAPWAALFFDDLAQAPAAQFYRHVAAVGRAFIDTENQAFALDVQGATQS